MKIVGDKNLDPQMGKIPLSFSAAFFYLNNIIYNDTCFFQVFALNLGSKQKFKFQTIVPCGSICYSFKRI